MPVISRSAGSSVSAPRQASEALGATRTLRRGSSGADVRQLQQSLTERGFPLAADGQFGPATEAAVRRFQQASGLAVDGVAGPMTMGRLQSAPVGPSGGAPVDGMDRTPRSPFGGAPRAPQAPTAPSSPAVTPQRGLGGAAAAGLPSPGIRQTQGGAVQVRPETTAARLAAQSPAHARLVADMRSQGFFPVRMADGGHRFMSNPSYVADQTGRGTSSREACAYADANGLRLPTRAEADAFRAQAPVVMQFEPGPTPGTAGARTATAQQARIAARMREAGIPENGVAVAGAAKVWALEPGQRPGLNGAVRNVQSGAAWQGYSTVHGRDYEDYSQAAQFVHPVRVSPGGEIVR